MIEISPEECARNLAVSIVKIQRGGDWFVCADCCRSTPNPNDVQHSYCPWCHEFKFDSFDKLKCFEPTCPNFGDRDFGEGSCPDFHAAPPARRGNA